MVDGKNIALNVALTVLDFTPLAPIGDLIQGILFLKSLFPDNPLGNDAYGEPIAYCRGGHCYTQDDSETDLPPGEHLDGDNNIIIDPPPPPQPITQENMLAAFKQNPSYPHVVASYNGIAFPANNRAAADGMVNSYFFSAGGTVKTANFDDAQMYSILTGGVDYIDPFPAWMDPDQRAAAVRYKNAWKGPGYTDAKAIKYAVAVSPPPKPDPLSNLTPAQKAKIHGSFFGVSHNGVRLYNDGKGGRYSLKNDTNTGTQSDIVPPVPVPSVPSTAQDPVRAKAYTTQQNKSIMNNPNSYDTNGHLVDYMTKMDEMKKMAGIMVGMADAQARMGQDGVSMADAQSNIAITDALYRRR